MMHMQNNRPCKVAEMYHKYDRMFLYMSKILNHKIKNIYHYMKKKILYAYYCLSSDEFKNKTF